jgi:hypothetical protein
MKDIDKAEVENFRKLLNYLKILASDGVTPLIEKQVITMLGYSLKFFSHLVMESYFPKINRLTINKNLFRENRRINEIKFLKYPPKEIVTKYGRCNKPNESVLYAGFDDVTILNELKPEVGDLITKSVWKTKGEQYLKHCPIFKNQPLDEEFINPRTFEINEKFEKLIKEYPTNVREQILILTQFVADSFSKRITTNNHLDYIFSAFFASKILNEFENGTIEAIYYPSVKNTLSFENLAIKPNSFDSKYELIEVKESVVIVDPSNGRKGYFMMGLSECKNFDYASGKILWDNNKFTQSKENIVSLTRKYNLILD